ncbi:hypothetical protein CL621_04440 [archaeon]|nr:hypothetical protein [archaeon]|tara:strand:- start:589 stop:1470 length:882 start_codon:yes stop_codon:yes gene_type:complete
MYIVGLDLGGTNIGVGLLKNNKIVKFLKLPTHANQGKGVVINQIIKAIELIISGIDKKNISGIGLGVPGPCDYKKGVLINPPNLPFRNVNLKNIIKKRFKKKVIMENDAGCAALAEKRFGVGKNKKNFILLTLGTGIGGGLIINNELYHGLGNGGELGHISIKSDGPKSKCGNDGCLEVLASGTAIVKRAKKILGKELKARELAQLARKGNKKARRVLEESGKYLGIGLANFVNIFNPELIILSGGVWDSGDILLNFAKKEMKKRALFNTEVVWSKLKEPGVLGAASLIKNAS